METDFVQQYLDTPDDPEYDRTWSDRFGPGKKIRTHGNYDTAEDMAAFGKYPKLPRQIIGVEFDGVLVEYDPSGSFYEIGAPKPEAVETVRRLLANHVEVVILTHRYAPLLDPGLAPDAQDAVYSKHVLPVVQWCREHLGCSPVVEPMSDFWVDTIWSSRAVARVI